MVVQSIFGILVGLMVGLTVWGYPRKYGALSGRSRLFRTIGVLLINLLFITILIYSSTDWHAQLYRIGMEPHNAARLVAASKLVYFLIWLLIGIFLLGVALLDMLENFTIYRRQRREALEAMIAGAVASHQQKRTAAVEGTNPSGNEGGLSG